MISCGKHQSSFNQPINQPTNQSTTDRPTETNQPINRPTDRSISHVKQIHSDNFANWYLIFLIHLDQSTSWSDLKKKIRRTPPTRLHFLTVTFILSSSKSNLAY